MFEQLSIDKKGNPDGLSFLYDKYNSIVYVSGYTWRKMYHKLHNKSNLDVQFF